VPEVPGQGVVTASSDALVVKVRHAQDIDAEAFEGDWDWATATVVVRSLTAFAEDAEDPVYDGVLVLPDGRLSVGDADSDVTLTDLSHRSRVQVHVPVFHGGQAASVRIDLAPETL
jgi:hypothetical protein